MASVVDLVWAVGRTYRRANRGVEERVPDPLLLAAGYLPIVVFAVAGLGWLTLFTGATVVGASGVAFAFVGAVLVRAVGLTFRSTSAETLLAAIVGVVTPFVAGLLFVRLLVGVTDVAHMGHLMSFTVATALEAGAVLSAHDGEGDGLRVRFSPGL
jgi:membrane associated rhomboid family serine protease